MFFDHALILEGAQVAGEGFGDGAEQRGQLPLGNFQCTNKFAVAVHDVPMEIEQRVCSLKLKSMSIGIDKLTPEQVEYLASSGEGT